MTTIWASSPIQIRDELQVDVKASAESVIFGTYNDAVQASDLVLTPEQAMEIADALTAAATHCLAARGEGMSGSNTPVVGGSGKASIATVQIQSCGPLLQSSRPDDGRAQATRSSGNDLPAPMDVLTALRSGGDMTIPNPSSTDVYAFLRERYLHSRFEGSASAKDFPDYAQTVTKSSLDQLLETGIGCISMYESNSGREVWFDRALRVLNPDEAPAQIQARAGNLTHIYGQAIA